MFIERKEYKLTHASESVTYDITDDYGHIVQLTPEQTETVYQWLASKSMQLHRDVQSDKPVEERRARMNRAADKPEEITQEGIFSLIEQALKDLDDDATPIQVQVWLIQHGVDLLIEQVSGNMKIVRDTIDGEWEE